jgi:hypothetical protein
LHKKREASQKKAMTMPNIDPYANDKQRLLQLDPTVVGNVSHTMGSSKEFTNEQYSASNRNKIVNANDHRSYTRQQHDAPVPPPIPSKENRAPYYKRDDDASFQAQRSLKSSRERMHVLVENEPRFAPTHVPHHHEPEQFDMISMQEQQPRVVVRSIRDDSNRSTYYQQQTPYDDSSPTFVSIPVQIEHSVPHQRFVSSPYHSDPYYPHVNS